jgi:peptidoglycan/LPS O-acetylase OafA/YrhL
MVAVLLVFANHLYGWPRGGFVGVDVFFVISGFLITGSLLRMAENNGNVSFRKFYWNRVRRIVPAATVVLILTYLTALLLFQTFRANQVGVDALFAFIFMSNWWFAIRGTNYFSAGDAVSPIQHYWSLSIEEQFYFVWPALIFVIGLMVARKAGTHDYRMRLAGTAMGAVIAVSLGWALYESASSPTWAYFDTFTRVWELGVGALMATMVGSLTRIPVNVKPWLSWGGLALIGASVVLIAEGSPGFPAPWALLPVLGSALVIAAGVGGEPLNQGFLTNPVAVYIGNISYSLYLVHWPVIVFLGVLMTPAGGSFYIAVVALTFALAIMSFHFVENPLRYGSIAKLRKTVNNRRRSKFEIAKSSRYAAGCALLLLTLGLVAAALQDVSPKIPAQALGGDGTGGNVQQKSDGPQTVTPKSGPLEAALQLQIVKALRATKWPTLDPSIEAAINYQGGNGVPAACWGIAPPSGDMCTWGSPSAPIKVMLVGDSLAIDYAGPLREIALNSDGRIRLHMEAMAGCQFTNDWITNSNKAITDACPARKQHTVEVINASKPDVVIISGSYGGKTKVGSDQVMAPAEWAAGVGQIVDKFKASTKKVVFLAAPPSDKDIKECYGTLSSSPSDCISEVTPTWLSIAEVTQGLAEAEGGVWIDSRPFFCHMLECPAFVGSTPTKRDVTHMTAAYAEKIRPVIEESFKKAGVF